MERTLGRYSDYAYALLRIAAGLMYLMHGTQKLFGWPGGEGTVELMSLRGLAGVIELVGGSMIMLGLFTSFAAFIASGEMAVAYFMVHLPQSFWPLLNNGELAALYAWLFLYFATKGSGTLSLDRTRRRTRRR